MKAILIFITTLFYCTGSFAQHVGYKRCSEISYAIFNKHQPVINFVTKPIPKVKLKGVIKIKTPVRTIILKDDGEMVEYKFEGYVKNSSLILIHELETNTEEYYLINKETATIDTLVGKPIFNKNGLDVVCLEGSGTDVKQRIQIGRIVNGRFKTQHWCMLKDDIYPDYVYWFNTNTIFIKTNRHNYRQLDF